MAIGVGIEPAIPAAGELEAYRAVLVRLVTMDNVCDAAYLRPEHRQLIELVLDEFAPRPFLANNRTRREARKEEVGSKPPPTRQEIANLIDSGLKQPEIARRLGVRPRTLGKWQQLYGLSYYKSLS